MQNLGYYESKNNSEYIVDDIGLDIDRIGVKNFEKSFPINLKQIKFINPEELVREIPEVIHFLSFKQQEYQQTSYNKRPLWFRINVIDQAANDYLGVGFLNLNEGWLEFIIYSLSIDRADQGGDGIFTIIDVDFKWAVNFELSQEDSALIVQKIEK